MAKIYFGVRIGEPGDLGTRVTKIHDGVAEDLTPRLDLAEHSPTGFEWGFTGAGSAQLALAILADASGIDDLALFYHQDFSAQIIIALDKDEWWLTEEQVSKWLASAWAPSRKYFRFGIEYISNEPDQIDSLIQAAIKGHVALFYHRWKVSGHQLASEIKPEEVGNNPYIDRWRLYIDMGTSEPDWARNQITMALCLHMNISELDFVVSKGRIVMAPESQGNDDNPSSED